MIIGRVAKGKLLSLGNSILMQPLPHRFGRYHRDMKILKILASKTPSGSEFKKWQIDDDRGKDEILHFLK